MEGAQRSRRVVEPGTLARHVKDRAEVEKVPSADPGEHEKATRQQGGFFFRENSSNGGKAIRTFLAS
jgi:hypothetical protein